MTKKSNTNWIHKGEEIININQFPKNAIGFIYLIRNLTNGRYYYGRKTCISNSKKRLTLAEKKLPENQRKTFKIIEKENSWKSYTGSNKLLNEHVKAGHIIEKEIIQFCFSKAELTFYETRAIVCSECMLTDSCYNDWISAKVYKRNLIK